jgi:ATP-dependent Clp protease adaptor protein ClpS
MVAWRDALTCRNAGIAPIGALLRPPNCAYNGRRGTEWPRVGPGASDDATIMSGINKRNGEHGPQTGIAVKPRPKTKKPSMYKVLMLNDDYTPMEFVVHVLERIFGMDNQQATQVMLHVHRRGVGVCGVFTFEVAETKVNQTMDLARQHQHPLQCTIEKDGDE